MVSVFSSPVLLMLIVHHRRDASGKAGMDRILQLLARLLNPSFSESGALFIGDLILHLLRNAGDHLAAVIPALLKALVERILTSKTTTFTQVGKYRYLKSFTADFSYRL